VDQFVRTCHRVQPSRTTRHATFGVLRAFDVPEKSWEHISVNFVVGLLEWDMFDAVWVVVDLALKMRHFSSCHTTIDAVGLAKLCLWKLVYQQGVPKTIVSYWGPQFRSTFFRQICSRLGFD
jgi:hypothetical protein